MATPNTIWILTGQTTPQIRLFNNLSFIFEHNESESENWADQVTGRVIVFFSVI